MVRRQDDGREVGYVIGGLGLSIGIALLIPVAWYFRTLIALALGFLMVMMISVAAARFGQLFRFVAAPIAFEPQVQQQTGLTMTASLTVTRRGADAADPKASRVVIEDAVGDQHVIVILPAGADPVPEMREVVAGLQVPVRSVRAMKGYLEVARWRPSLGARVALAWKLAADP